jgi:hypothetical protein
LRTIVAMPVYRAAHYWDQVASFLYRLDPQPDLWLFAENNSPDDTLRRLQRFHRPKEILQPKFTREELANAKAYDIIGKVRQMLLDRARELNPDYLLFLDSDIRVFSTHLLWDMTLRGKDILGGPYARPFPQGLFLAALWSSSGPKGFELHRRATRPMERVAAVGGGCMLLSQRLIQDRRVNFIPVPENSSEDYGFCLTAAKYGYESWLDGTIGLLHWVTSHHIKGKAWQVDEQLRPMPFPYATGK